MAETPVSNDIGEPPDCRQISDELVKLLVDFSVAVLRGRPANLKLFAKNYFTLLVDTENGLSSKRADSEDLCDDGMSMEKMMEMCNLIHKPERRTSVAVETMNPSEAIQTFHKKTSEQQHRLDCAIERIEEELFLYKKLDQQQKASVKASMTEVPVTVGTVVIQEGTEGDNFYVVDSGIFHATKATGSTESCPPEKSTEQLLCAYNGSGFFGELALLHGDKRAATVTAVTDGVLWALDQKSFRSTMLSSQYGKYARYERLLREIPLLSLLNEEELCRLAESLKSKTFFKGEQIIKEGDPADAMYFIEDGTVSVQCRSPSGKEIQLKTLARGQYFGEVALIQQKPRVASIYAATSLVTVAELDTRAFVRLLGPLQDVMERDLDVYRAERLRLGLDH